MSVPTIHSALWDRLAAFDLDGGLPTRPFSSRLARENGWSPEHTARVIAEYKCFVYLALRAGHSVTPSDAVDQAWHLHLTDTEGYFDHFCTEVLRAPLHHRPSRGGPGERARYIADYERTLLSYERLFGNAAPSDIWPTSERRFGADLDVVRVSRSEHWIIRKPLVSTPRRALAFLTVLRRHRLLALLVLGAAVLPIAYLDGLEFLVFQILLEVSALLTAVTLKKAELEDSPAEASAPALDPYETAYLVGDHRQTIDAAIARLVTLETLAFDPDQRRLSLARRVSDEAHPIERGVFDLVARVASVDAVYGQSAHLTRPIEQRLLALGLWTRGSRLPLAMALVPVAVGSIRMGVGLWRDKPIGLLFLLTLMGALLALCFGRSSRPTSHGHAVGAELQRRHAGLAQSLGSSAATEQGVARDLEVHLAVALFGWSALAATPWERLSRLSPPLPASSDGGGGVADGGAGGCGGGCGGCGGCGG